MFGRYRIWVTICGSKILTAHLTHFFEAHRIEVSSWHTIIIDLISNLLLIGTQNLVPCCWIPRRTFFKFEIPGLKLGLPSSTIQKEYRENTKWSRIILFALDECFLESAEFFLRSLRYFRDLSFGLNAVHGDHVYEALETSKYSLIPVQRLAVVAPETRRGRNSDAIVSLFKIAPVAAEHSEVSASNGSLSIAASRSRKRSQERRADPLLYFAEPSPRVAIHGLGGAGKSFLYHHQSQLYYQTRLHVTRSVGRSWLESDDYNTDSQDQKIRISHMSAISRGDEPLMGTLSQKTDLILDFLVFGRSFSCVVSEGLGPWIAMLHEENGMYSIFEDKSSRTLYPFADPTVYDLLMLSGYDSVVGAEEENHMPKTLHGRTYGQQFPHWVATAFFYMMTTLQAPSTVSRKDDPFIRSVVASRRPRIENFIFDEAEIGLRRRRSPLSAKESGSSHFYTTHTRDPLRRHNLNRHVAAHHLQRRHGAAHPLLRRLHFLPGSKGARRRQIWRDVDSERWKNQESLPIRQPPDIPPCKHCLNPGWYWLWFCGLCHRPWRSILLRFIYLSISLTTICAGLLYVRKLGL